MSSEYLRVKTKLGSEVRRFALQRNILTFGLLQAEIAKIHGVPASSSSLVQLKKLKGATGPFGIDALKQLLDSRAPQISLSVELVEAESEGVSLETPVVQENATRRTVPSFIGVPHPWPRKHDVNLVHPEIIWNSPEQNVRQDKVHDTTFETSKLPDFLKAYKTDVTLWIKGEKRVVADVGIVSSLDQYLRRESDIPITTASRCRNGTCGGCKVVLTFLDSETKKPKHVSANSCLLTLPSCDGVNISDMPQVDDGHECSTCATGSPKMVSQMFDLLLDANLTALSALGSQEQEHGHGHGHGHVHGHGRHKHGHKHGHTCSCSGEHHSHGSHGHGHRHHHGHQHHHHHHEHKRSLFESFQTDLSDSKSSEDAPNEHHMSTKSPLDLLTIVDDEEDSGSADDTEKIVVDHLKFGDTCGRTGESCDTSCTTGGRACRSGDIEDLGQAPEEREKLAKPILKYRKKPFYLNENDKFYFRPVKTSELHRLLGFIKHLPYRVISKSRLYYEQNQTKDQCEIIIDVSQIPEFKKIVISRKGIEFGAAVAIREMSEVLEKNSDLSPSFSKIVDHLNSITTSETLSVISWLDLLNPGANVDISALLASLNSEIIFSSYAGSDSTISISVDQYLQDYKTGRSNGAVERIFIPSNKSGTLLTFSDNEMLNLSYCGKLVRNRLKNVSLVLTLKQCDPAAFAFVRATKTEDFLIQKRVTNKTLEEATKILVSELTCAFHKTRCSDVQYQKGCLMLASNIFYKFFVLLQPVDTISADVLSTLNFPSQLPRSDDGCLDELPSVLFKNEEQCLWATPIVSPKAGKLLSVDLSEAAKLSEHSMKVVDFVSSRNLDTINSQNEFGLFPGDLELFPTQFVSAGQTVGLLITESRSNELGSNAQNLVDISVESNSQILSIREETNLSSLFHDNPEFGISVENYIENGNCDKGMEIADQILEGGFSFTLEPSVEETCLCVAKYNGETLHILTDAQDDTHFAETLSTILGIPVHKIEIEQTFQRCGGLDMVTAQIAVAAWSLKKTVRYESVMKSAQEEGLMKYSVGFKNDGKITALKQDLFVNGGSSYKETLQYQNLLKNHTNLYDFPSRTQVHLVKTNKSSLPNSNFSIDSSLFTEAVMNRVAQTLQLHPEDVQEENLNSSHPQIKDCLDMLKFQHGVLRKRAEITKFNKKNRFVKRGLSINSFQNEGILGAALSVAEIDGLTGVHILHSTDIVYDAHKESKTELDNSSDSSVHETLSKKCSEYEKKMAESFEGGDYRTAANLQPRINRIRSQIQALTFLSQSGGDIMSRDSLNGNIQTFHRSLISKVEKFSANPLNQKSPPIDNVAQLDKFGEISAFLAVKDALSSIYSVRGASDNTGFDIDYPLSFQSFFTQIWDATLGDLNI